MVTIVGFIGVGPCRYRVSGFGAVAGLADRDIR
jgi:hypothetical protein